MTTRRANPGPAKARAKSGRKGAGSAARPPKAASAEATYLLVLSSRERGGRRFVRLKAPSVLAWFQKAWRGARDGAEQRQRELGGEVFGLERVFAATAAEGLGRPTSEAALVSLLTRTLTAEGDVEAEPHFVHVEAEDDGRPVEYFLFDERFLESGEALDRLPSLERRAGDEDEPEDDDEEDESPEPVEEPEPEDDDDDDDSYKALIERLMDQ